MASTTTPTTQPEPIRPPTASAEALSPQERPAAPSPLPTDNELYVGEANQRAREEYTEQTAATFVAFLAANGYKLTDPGLTKVIDGFKDEDKKTHLQKLQTELAKFYTEDGGKLLIQGFEQATNPARAEKATLAAVAELMLKGQLTGELFSELVGGGIHFAPKNPHPKHVENIDEIAHFIPPNDQSNARIVLYEAAYGENMDPRKVIYHELGHALLIRDGALYNHNNFRIAPSTSELGIQNSELANRAPHLTKVEQDAVSSALSNPNRARNWETPYVAQLLDQLAGPRAGDSRLQRHIIQEMLAERVRIYFESDGSLGDFVAKRLMSSESARQQMDSTPADATQAQSLEPLARKVQQFLAEKLPAGAATDNSYLASIDQFVTQSALEGIIPESLQVPLKGFLDESYYLHTRYSRLAGPDNQARLLKLLQESQAKIATYPLESDWEIGEESIMGTGIVPTTAKGKGLWQWMMEMFADLAQSLRG